MKTTEKAPKKVASKRVTVVNNPVTTTNQTLKSGKKLIPQTSEQAKKLLKVDPAVTSAKKITQPKTKSGLSIFLKELIQQGKFTQKEIFTQAHAKFPLLASSTISTLLTDSKNPKYNKFEKLVVVDDKGLMKFSI
jgi:hypothetical protein